MNKDTCRFRRTLLRFGSALGLSCLITVPVWAQPDLPVLVDPGLSLTTVVTNLQTPTSMAFLGDNDFLVLEKASGRVQRVVNGEVSTVLDLPVNSAVERGLLGIALHPRFPRNPGV